MPIIGVDGKERTSSVVDFACHPILFPSGKRGYRPSGIPQKPHLRLGTTYQELASSPAQNEAFRRTVEVAEALLLGKGQQLTGTLRCLSLQGVGLKAF